MDPVARALDVQGALARAGDAVARGNRRVFDEIGREFARFVAAFEHATAYEADRIDAFCAALRTGDPPDGQRLLRAAFAAYGRARFHGEAKARADLMLYANLMIGLHEQTRLEPEITAALDAAFEHFDWSDLDERMHFIADFFPAYHERARTFEAPFTAEQAVELKAGRRPRGPL